MKQSKKIIKIVLILLLISSIIQVSYAAKVLQDSQLQGINAQIKNYLKNNGCNLDESRYTFNNIGTKIVEYNYSSKQYTITIKLEKRNNLYIASIDSKVVESNGAGLPHSIEDEQTFGGTTQDKGGSTNHSAGEIINESKGFIQVGENASQAGISETNLKNLSNTIYNILLVIGIVIAVILAGILGIKFITGGVEGQVDVKKALVPYIGGCIVVFGAFAIWKIVVNILSTL